MKWKTEIYNSVASAKQTRVQGQDVLTKQDGGRWFGAKKDDLPADTILVRNWHKALWDRHKDKLATDHYQVIIIGTPGIGKSLGLNYILWEYLRAPKAVQKKRYVALILPNSNEYFLFDTTTKKACRRDFFGRQELSHLIPFLDDLLVLHDLGTDAPVTPSDLPTVLATSPKEDKYKEFRKNASNACLFYVPLFTDAEMDYMAANIMPSDHNYDAAWQEPRKRKQCTCWRDVAYFYGNVPRLVFGRSSFHNSIINQLDSLRQEKMELRIPPESRIPAIVEYVPSTDFKNVSIQFRSGYVAACIADM